MSHFRWLARHWQRVVVGSPLPKGERTALTHQAGERNGTACVSALSFRSLNKGEHQSHEERLQTTSYLSKSREGCFQEYHNFN